MSTKIIDTRRNERGCRSREVVTGDASFEVKDWSATADREVFARLYVHACRNEEEAPTPTVGDFGWFVAVHFGDSVSVHLTPEQATELRKALAHPVDCR